MEIGHFYVVEERRSTDFLKFQNYEGSVRERGIDIAQNHGQMRGESSLHGIVTSALPEETNSSEMRYKTTD